MQHSCFFNPLAMFGAVSEWFCGRVAFSDPCELPVVANSSCARSRRYTSGSTPPRKKKQKHCNNDIIVWPHCADILHRLGFDCEHQRATNGQTCLFTLAVERECKYNRLNPSVVCTVLKLDEQQCDERCKRQLFVHKCLLFYLIPSPQV